MIEITSLHHLLSFVESKRKVTVIDFYADWCGPCQQIMPLYENMMRYNDLEKVNFCKCNVDRNRDSAAHFNIRAMPTFVVCMGGKTLTTVQGGNLEIVQRNINIGLSQLIPSEAETAAAAAALPSVDALHNAFAEKMLAISLAKEKDDPVSEKDNSDGAYALLSSSSPEQPRGLVLLPYLASQAFSPISFETLMINIASRAVPECYEGGLLITQVWRHIAHVASCLTWDDLSVIQALHRVLFSLLQCKSAHPAITHCFMLDTECIRTGYTLELMTVLGGLFGIGPIPRTQILNPLERKPVEWRHLMNIFPSHEKQNHPQAIYNVQKIVETLAQMNYRLTQAFLQNKSTRDATLRFFARALAVNEDYQKTMYRSNQISSRFFMIQMQSVLIKAALPVVQDVSFSTVVKTIPAHYLLEDARNPALVSFGADVERVTHFDKATNPIPPFPTEAGPYKPLVHLFFLAARALTLCACVFIDEHERDSRSATHPQVSQQDRAAMLAEKCLYEGLLGGIKLAEERLEYLNGLALWMLHIMRVNEAGQLPETPPVEWQYLPQQLVDCVIRATRLAPLGTVFVDGMISMLLVLMGNTLYFPKPHTHALFPAYLIRLYENQDTLHIVEQNPWFSERIVRACMDCYIAVEKSIYERVNVRYELSCCLEKFLRSDSLCRSVREEFKKEGTVLERFSHMAVGEVNEAVDQLIQSLTKMNHMVRIGADLSEDGSALPSNDATAPDNNNNNNNSNNNNSNNAADHRPRNRNGDSQAEEEGGNREEEARADGGEENMSYHQIGLSLRSNIMLFTASIDMFIRLSVQFPRGVSQNLVSQQISQMLARSLVAFAGPKSKNLKIEYAERYQFKPREVLSRLVDCLVHFRRSRNFLNCLCHCGVSLEAIQSAIRTVLERQLVSEDLLWKLSEMLSALNTVSKEVNEEEVIWDEAPDFALDALLSTPLHNPVALPTEVKDLQDLIYVNRDTIHHLLLSESKHPFTKEYLDEAMVEAFNSRPDVAAARENLKNRISDWLNKAKKQT